ncbi:MAG TPA: glutamate-1-semialdehyde 2,1-aminomutase [Paludibacter sp.]|nr:glutamate-1-semialdehyde 2,1-aminomutase [Paludibacter sp.]
MQRILSEKAYNEACNYIPGGVNSPVRALRSVGEAPLFIAKADGTTLTDVDGNQFTDFCLSWGVFILGHNHPQVRQAVNKAIELGTSYGIPTLQETQLAKLVVEAVPSVEKVRFVSSGTEAVMSAIRVARGFTKRNIIVKFDGNYHGHADHLLVSAGSGVAQLSGSSSSGVPADFTKYTLSLPYNNVEAVKVLFEKQGNEIAAVILEPVAANMGVVIPTDEFLKTLREITTKYGALLIFDEVITGFRLGLSGAQGRFGITPDLSAFGKIIGGGFPAAAFGGRADIMDLLAPLGPVYQAGTLSGNPVAMASGIQTISLLSEPDFYTNLEVKSNVFVAELKDIIKRKDIVLNHIGSMFTLFFSDDEIRNFDDVKRSDTDRFAKFFRELLKENIYISPSAFEASFISAGHTNEQLEKVLRTIKKVINKI